MQTSCVDRNDYFEGDWVSLPNYMWCGHSSWQFCVHYHWPLLHKHNCTQNHRFSPNTWKRHTFSWIIFSFMASGGDRSRQWPLHLTPTLHPEYCTVSCTVSCRLIVVCAPNFKHYKAVNTTLQVFSSDQSNTQTLLHVHGGYAYSSCHIRECVADTT